MYSATMLVQWTNIVAGLYLESADIMANSSRGRRRWTYIPVVALVGIIIMSIMVWPWFRADDRGFVLSFERPLSNSNPSTKITTWRSRSGRLLVRSEGLLGGLYFIADSNTGTVRGLFDEKLSIIDIWAILPDKPDYYLSGKLPVRNEMVVRGDVVEIRTPDAAVVLKLDSRSSESGNLVK